MAVVDLAPGLVLVTGPSRSGRAVGLNFSLNNKSDVTYVATSAPRPNDVRWQQRIVRHQQRRPSRWSVVECGDDLAGAMHAIPANQTLLIDALGGFTASLSILTLMRGTVIDDLVRACRTARNRW